MKATYSAGNRKHLKNKEVRVGYLEKERPGIMTQVGDLVLVHMQENPAFFARIESITPVVKPDWFHVKMLVLQVPLTVATWILRSAYIDGVEFTMGGTPIRMVKVVSAEEEKEELPEPPVEEPAKPKRRTRKKPSDEPAEKGKVVSLFDRKRKDQPS